MGAPSERWQRRSCRRDAIGRRNHLHGGGSVRFEVMSAPPGIGARRTPVSASFKVSRPGRFGSPPGCRRPNLPPGTALTVCRSIIVPTIMPAVPVPVIVNKTCSGISRRPPEGTPPVPTDYSSAAARTSAKGATTVGRAGELALNSFVAELSIWPSSNETSVDALRFTVSGFSCVFWGTLTEVDTAGKGRTNVRSATDVWPAERSPNDRTTLPPAVAPTAVATSTVRIVRKKLGAGARQPHSG